MTRCDKATIAALMIGTVANVAVVVAVILWILGYVS